MADALFITRQDISVFTAANGGIDDDKLLPFLKTAQDKHVQIYLGTELYNAIKTKIEGSTLTGDYLTLVRDYIKDMMLHWAMVEYLPFGSVNIANGGIYQKNPENSTPITREHVDYLVEKSRSNAQFYTDRMVDYLKFNNSKYPEYYQNSNDDMYPDDVANFVGIVL